MFVAGRGAEIRNATIIFPGRLDRSPCGTGTAARLAVMHERGQLGVNEELSAYSIIGGHFFARIARRGGVPRSAGSSRDGNLNPGRDSQAP